MLNLTQHRATQEQILAGVVDMPEPVRARLSELLTFDEIPDADELNLRARAVAMLVMEKNELGDPCLQAMIGGAPFFMRYLEVALLDQSVEPVYAFTRREVEEITVGGGLQKTSVFRHVGFVRPYEAHFDVL